MTCPADSTTLQLTCTVDRHTIIWVRCAPASVCSIRTCKYMEGAQNSKCGLAVGGAKQRVGLKETLDMDSLFQKAVLGLSSDAGQKPCSGQPLTGPVSVFTEELRRCWLWLGQCYPPQSIREKGTILYPVSFKSRNNCSPCIKGSFCLEGHFSSLPRRSF